MDSANIVDLIVSILNPAYIVIAVALAWFMRKIGPAIYIIIPFCMIVLNIVIDAILGMPSFTIYYVGQILGIGIVALLITIIVLSVAKKLQK